LVKIDLAKFLKRYDLSFFVMTGCILIVGVVNLYSATHATSFAGIYRLQIYKYLFALFIGILVSFIRPKTLYRYSYLLYVLNIIFLILVLVVGKNAQGAQRWLELGGPIRFQPSEMMKVTLILALGKWFTKNYPDRPLGLRNLTIPLLMSFIPAGLIIVEPDLGTGLTILLVFAFIVFYRKLKWKSILILGLLGLITGSFMYQFGLKEYQKKRIITFLDPQSDARGSGYNAIQSVIAIGSGQLLGKGLKKSSQASLNYLPENHTDFAFSVFNEEHGFVGSVILIALYVSLFLRFVWLSISVLKIFDSIVAMGLMSILFWHTFINMGMVTGLLPIVGLPLPFISYGGSSLVIFMVCCGMATSISNSRNLF